MEANDRKRRRLALVPVVVLVAMLAGAISIFGPDAILGASQVSLLVAAGVCAVLSRWIDRTPWRTIEQGIRSNVGEVAGAILILLLIGAISGTWMMSGIVPTLICYGLKIISPKVFLLTACVLCALVSLLIGSSWTTIATVGVALLGIGRAEGFSDAMTAGAIISGAYFGDKISPLSDTTVLASSVNRVDLFVHIRYMMLTTGPAILITLVIFTVLGLSHSGAPSAQMAVYAEVLGRQFNLTPWLLLVPALTGFLIWKRLPAVAVLALSAGAAALAAVLVQPGIISEIGARVTQGSPLRVGFAGVLEMIADTVSLETGNVDVDKLVSSRGMTGMLGTVYLIICAMCFGGCMQATGMIGELAAMLSPLTRTRAGLVGSTVLTGVGLNGLVSDQYLSIILTSNIYRDSYEKGGYELRLLSRSVEDSSTVTSPLFPWSSCGMTQATILSVSTLAYAPFCFFNILSPLMSLLMALLGFRIPQKRE